MRDLDYDLTEISILSHNVAVFGAELKAMRSAPRNTHLPIHIRQMELRLDFYESRLRLARHLFRKYHPDQPRVPVGHSDGGQWTNDGGTDNGGTGSAATNNERLRPTKVDFSGVKPSAETVRPAPKPLSPPKPGSGLRGGGAAIIAEPLKQFIERDPFNSSFRGTAHEATERYNWLLKNAPETTVPALHFTPHEFRAGPEPKHETVVVPMLREQVERACPLYKAVQAEANRAAQAAGKRSDYRSAAEYGTKVHTIMKDNILQNYYGRLIPERSFLKYAEELTEVEYGENGVRYGLLGSLRLDVLEKVKDGVICVYDLKTGKGGLTPARMLEIGQSVHKNFSNIYRIFIIPIQPGLNV
jgi:hypothetical protein